MQIDAKGRVNLPSAFRRALSADQLVLLQWQPTHLDLLPLPKPGARSEENLLAHTGRTQGDRRGIPEERHVQVRRISNPTRTDGSGSPSSSSRRSGCGDTVLFIGALDRIELWHPAPLRRATAASGTVTTTASRLGSSDRGGPVCTHSSYHVPVLMDEAMKHLLDGRRPLPRRHGRRRRARGGAPAAVSWAAGLLAVDRDPEALDDRPGAAGRPRGPGDVCPACRSGTHPAIRSFAERRAGRGASGTSG